MIAFVKGSVQSYGADWVVVDNHGIGWKILYPHTDRLRLNMDVTIFTYLHYTETDLCLYGFESQQEMELFLKLISVKGLGPKTALNMLSKSSGEKLSSAIVSGNVDVLKSMPGIGPKTARQIVLDLQGKLVAMPKETAKKDRSQYPQDIADACEGLRNLGYRGSDLSQAADYMMSQQGEHTVQEYLKIGLQYLLKNHS